MCVCVRARVLSTIEGMLRATKRVDLYKSGKSNINDSTISLL
jgi:hypothetical protein